VFPLAGKAFPTSGDELAKSIQEALGTVLSFAKKSAGVTVQSPKFPVVKQLKVDLDGATVNAGEPPPTPAPSGKRQPGIQVGQLEVSGHPINYEASKVDLELSAKDVSFEFAKDKKGNPLLVLSEAGEGSVDVNVTKANLQALAKAVASAAAKEQGVTIQDVEVDLQQQGKRSLTANARVKAKKMLVSGVIHVKGALEVDDELKATVSDLSCTGEGMIGTMVSSFVQPKLKAYNGKQIPLMTFSLGDVALRDLKIDAKNGLHVTARFGK